ncbi:MAG: hypothetical protein IT431_06900 [Phycisphaerales bacterium]|nr:hypothetical protein [Phycisphaerales bacterium]
MSERPSLMEQAGLTDAAPAARKAGAGPNANALKIAGAVALSLVALGVLAWATGLIGADGAPKVDPKLAQERQQRLEQEVKEEAARDAKLGVTPVESGG